LKGLLAFSPDKRLTVDEAINHPYFEELRKRDIPPKCMKVFDWDWEENLRSKARSL
jgi:serine/threonine protein kinase